MRLYQFRLLIQRRKRRLTAAPRRAERALRLLPLLILPLFFALMAFLTAGCAWLLENLNSGLPDEAMLASALRHCPAQNPTRITDRSGLVPLAVLAEPGIDPVCPPLRGQNAFSPDLLKAAVDLIQPDFWKSPAIDWSSLIDPQPKTIAERAALDWFLEAEPPSPRRALRMRLLAAQMQSQVGREGLLQAWLNQAWFGRLAYGADSASQVFLGVRASELTFDQAAFLIRRLDSPAEDLATENFPAIWAETQIGLLAAGEIDKLSPAPPVIIPAPIQQPAAIDAVIEQARDLVGRQRLERGGLSVRSTLDAGLQSQTACLLSAQLERIHSGGFSPNPACPAARLLPTIAYRSDAELFTSAVILDPTTGQVLALAGETTLEGGQHPLRALPASPLVTPFIAETAFTRGYSPASLVWDLPEDPRDPGEGPVRLRWALAADLFRPLTALVDDLEPSFVWTTLSRMGLGSLASFQGDLRRDPPELTLLELAQAWSLFPNLGLQNGLVDPRDGSLDAQLVLDINGYQGPLVDISARFAQKRLLDPAPAYLVHDVLADTTLRWSLWGQGNPLEIGRPSAGKLGSAADGTQVWAAGYTPQRLTIVWLGTADGEGRQGAQLDVRTAGGIWHALMQTAAQDLEPAGWQLPPGVTRLKVCDPSGLLPSSDCPRVVEEVFLNGSEPLAFDELHALVRVDRETGLLATVFTPLALTSEELRWQLPDFAQPWAVDHGLSLMPEEFDAILQPGRARIQILSPAALETVSGSVQVKLSAETEGLRQMTLQAGEGVNPSAWLQIGASDQGSWQVEWDTRRFQGLVTLRLAGEYDGGYIDTAFVLLRADNQPSGNK